MKKDVCSNYLKDFQLLGATRRSFEEIIAVSVFIVCVSYLQEKLENVFEMFCQACKYFHFGFSWFYMSQAFKVSLYSVSHRR